MQAIPIRTVQIILFAMALGLILFAGLVAFLRSTQPAFEQNLAPEVLAFAVPALFVPAAGICLAVQSAASRAVKADREHARALLEQGSIPPALARAAITGAALSEGVGLLGTGLVLIGGSLLLFAAPLVSVIWILLLVPTRERLENRVKDQG